MWGSRCARYLFVAMALCTTLHWRSDVMGSLYKQLQLPSGKKTWTKVLGLPQLLQPCHKRNRYTHFIHCFFSLPPETCPGEGLWTSAAYFLPPAIPSQLVSCSSSQVLRQCRSCWRTKLPPAATRPESHGLLYLCPPGGVSEMSLYQGVEATELPTHTIQNKTIIFEG